MAGAIDPWERRGGLDGRLTVREQEVLALLAAGARVAEIASRLEIQKSTVRTHLTRIYGKLNTPGRLQATLWAIRNLQAPP